jgi:hypothetical protein
MPTVLSIPTSGLTNCPTPETPSDSPEIKPTRLPIATLALIVPSNVLSSAVAPVMLSAFWLIPAVVLLWPVTL